jgi:hypothetical protein
MPQRLQREAARYAGMLRTGNGSKWYKSSERWKQAKGKEAKCKCSLQRLSYVRLLLEVLASAVKKCKCFCRKQAKCALYHVLCCLCSLLLKVFEGLPLAKQASTGSVRQ